MHTTPRIPDHEQPIAQTPLASLQGVSKSYGPVRALHDVDLALHAGEVLALLGANGAGKSTAVGLLLGAVQADAGRVELLGRSPRALSARRGAGWLQSRGARTLRVV